MRYFKPAAFLLALISGSVPLLSRTAQAASEDANNTSQASEQATLRSDLATLLDSAQGETNRTLLTGRSRQSSASSAARSAASSEVSADASKISLSQPLPAVAEPAFSSAVSNKAELKLAKAMDLEDFRRLINESEAEEPDAAVSTDETIETEPSVRIESDGTESNSTEPISAESDSAESDDVQSVDVQSDSVQIVPDLSQTNGNETPNEDDLPTLEESSPPTDSEMPETGDEVPAAPPANSGDEESEIPDGIILTPPEDEPESQTAEGPEIGGFPDSLLSDPNPLTVPTAADEVDIERNPVVTLEQAIDLAYRNNQALQAALLQLEQAEAQLDEAKAGNIPTVTAGSSLQRLQEGSINQTTLNGTLQVDYDLYTGGQRKASIRAAELQTEVTALAVEAQQEQLKLVTSNLYYELQDTGEQIRINESFVAEAARNLRDSELRQEVGVGTRFDVLRADVQLANAQQQLVQSRFNQDIARRDIARLLNLPSTAGLQTTPVQKAETWPLNLEDSILLAFQNRSELQQQLLQSEISEQQRQIALSALRPQVSLFARYGLTNLLTTNATTRNPITGQSTSVDTGFQDGTTTFGVNFNMTLFDGGASRARARQQEISGQLAEEQFSENLDQFRFDVEQAFFNLQANEENIATSRVAVAQAEEALNLANLRLQAGVGTQLEVLTAQSELTQAQGNNVAAILGYNRALAAMQRAVSNLRL